MTVCKVPVTKTKDWVLNYPCAFAQSSFPLALFCLASSVLVEKIKTPTLLLCPLLLCPFPSRMYCQLPDASCSFQLHIGDYFCYFVGAMSLHDMACIHVALRIGLLKGQDVPSSLA